MKIDYTNYCKDNLTVETNGSKIKAMFEILKVALISQGVKGKINATYYTDGNIKVEVNGQYYNMFDSMGNKFFSGYALD